MSSISNKRIKWIDIAKGIGIYLVVLGHLNVGYTVSFLQQFHVPLFFFLSGYVYSLNTKQGIRKFVIKKIKQIYVPFVLFGIAFVMLHNMLISCGVYSTEAGSMYFTQPYDMKGYLIAAMQLLVMKRPEISIYPYWFLRYLFIAAILYKIMESIVNFIVNKIKSRNENGGVPGMLL